MKKLSFVGLACTATIVTTLVFTPPTIATGKPIAPTVEATHQVASTQIAMRNGEMGETTLGVQKTARRRPNTPFEIFVGIIMLSLLAVVVMFKQRIGNWTIRQVSNLSERMGMERLDRY
jgi:hypothetical protein